MKKALVYLLLAALLVCGTASSALAGGNVMFGSSSSNKM